LKAFKTKRRKTGIYLFSLLCFAFAGIAFAGGLATNPSVRGVASYMMGTKSPSQSESESDSFSTPGLFWLNSTIVSSYVQANLTLSGSDLSLGEPVTLEVNMSIAEPATKYVSGVSVEVENTFQSVVPYTSTIGLGGINESLGRRLWFGRGLFEFNTVGPLIVDTTIFAVDKADRLQTVGLGKNILSRIVIAPSGSGLMNFYQNENLSLTAFILFFASLDIGVTLYDHRYENAHDTKDCAEDNPLEQRAE
jgi:hypothetical protein